jgi:hypothetical protein
MIRPNEIVVPIDDAYAVERSVPQAEVQVIKTDPFNNEWVTYLLLILYCGVASVSGFIVVKSSIGLLDYIARKGYGLRNELPDTQTNNVVHHEHESTALIRLTLLLVCGLVLAGGFVYAAGQHFAAVQYGYKTEELRREQTQLLEEQRRLILEFEREASPERLEAAARAIGMTHSGLKIEVAPAKVQTESIAPSKIIVPDDNSVISPATLKFILIALAFLGGSVGFVLSLSKLSELIIQVRSRTPLVKRAPGSIYLLIVDFLYSPKAVEGIFKPIIADWRTEYFDALKQGRTTKARWISIRYSFRFVSAMGLSQAYAFIRILRSAGK